MPIPAAAIAAHLALLPRGAPHAEHSNPNGDAARRGLLRFAVAQTLLPTRSRARSIGIRCEGAPRDDGFYMRRCVELARRAAGCTSPNPMVGCVIVKGGEVVGEGFHPKAGQPHAEVFALRNAGHLAENATAYVSLEPCNHYGRTPPCTEALIHAKVKRVVLGMVDPNPIVASKGVERLRGSGIDVSVGVEEMLCWKLNEAYIHRMLTGRPFVTLRYSLAINGGILNHTGKGAKELGGYYSQLLQEYDAVIISGYSLNKNSMLPASEEVGAKQPLIIIVARRASSPLCLPALAKEDSTRAIIFIEENAVVDPETDKNLNQLGVERVVLDKIRLNPIIEYCAHQGFCSLLLDLTHNPIDVSELFEEAMEEGMLQKVITEICPVWRDKSAASSVVEVGAKPLKLRDLQSRISNSSVIVEGYIA